VSKAQRRTKAGDLKREIAKFIEQRTTARSARVRLRGIIEAAERIIARTPTPPPPRDDKGRIPPGAKWTMPPQKVSAREAKFAAEAALQAIKRGDAEAATAEAMRAVYEITRAVGIMPGDAVGAFTFRGFEVEVSKQDREILAALQKKESVAWAQWFEAGDPAKNAASRLSRRLARVPGFGWKVAKSGDHFTLQKR